MSQDCRGGLYAGANFAAAATAKGLALERCVYVNHERGTVALDQRGTGFRTWCDAQGLPLEVWYVNGANPYAMETAFRDFLADFGTQTGAAVLTQNQALKPLRKIMKELGISKARCSYVCRFRWCLWSSLARSLRP